LPTESAECRFLIQTVVSVVLGGKMNEVKATRSGRQARQIERAKKGGGMRRPYIIRNIPSYDILSEENLVKVEHAADRILAETGIIPRRWSCGARRGRRWPASW